MSNLWNKKIERGFKTKIWSYSFKKETSKNSEIFKSKSKNETKI